MKAIVLNEQNELIDQEVEMRPVSENEVLIRIMASAFNPIDYQMRESEQERKYLFSPILGREFSGIVEKTGSAVTDFRIGDGVFCACGSMGSNGSYATHILVPQEIAALKPQSVSFEEAAALPVVGITSLQALNRIALTPETRILVTGASAGVGNFLVKLLLAKGIKHLTVTAGNKDRHQQLTMIGVQQEQIADYHNPALSSELIKRNGGVKFDIVVDCVGHYLSEIAAEVMKANAVYVDITNRISAKGRDMLFDIGATVHHISNFVYAGEKRYAYFRQSLQQIRHYIDETEVTPPAITVIGGLSAENAEYAQHLLQNNRTPGSKLIMQNQI
ncbi:GroES-like protein [Sphingobacterium spiritivorum ATCC 33300]|uniref:GroES-like protein n=1 Tax=Sphingobacterium spiritivorum ATCC 33300 TaxID=525372 RepID=C2FVG4_SPHSI|nr:NADP-dependent oxidoreductase [Sphingobacterium spiritivorum]EEI93022.1 GroES-like protein [Sphingobacterium spiritivorum ATCC 33300]QQS96174.1 NADP-dependent oxidoreductase [Sphingobacterium spiritivorum]